VFTEGESRLKLEAIADAILAHDRVIHKRTDDSVVRSFGSTAMVLRRARGFVPNPLALAEEFVAGSADECVLGVGAELKSTVCITRGSRAFVSTHLGDLEHVEAFRSFYQTIADLQTFLQVQPTLVVHDLHPEYLSTKWAREQDFPTLAVQHHHAHIASCIAEHGIEGRVLGLAFDGHGYGPDGTLWGGEFLVADLHDYERVGHLRPVALPGGATAIRDPWRMAVAYLERAYETVCAGVPGGFAVRQRNETRWRDVEAVARSSTTIQTSSMGRLFDAVAAILGVRDRGTFEGQAAMELEQFARRGISNDPFFVPPLAAIAVVNSGEGYVLDPSAYIRSLAESVGNRQLEDPMIESLAHAAHRCIADAAVRVSKAICIQRDLSNVVLSGGVFQNVLLTEMVRTSLEAAGCTVLTHQRVPANDGGISLGQVVIGLAHLQRSGAK
jgi:hydrogenase maturation protein HypF